MSLLNVSIWKMSSSEFTYSTKLKTSVDQIHGLHSMQVNEHKYENTRTTHLTELLHSGQYQLLLGKPTHLAQFPL